MYYPTNINDCSNAGHAACSENALPNQTMADIMHETNQMADDALAITNRLYGFLFPDNICSADRAEEPRCFRDELLRTRANLHTAVAKLAEIGALLGM